jgi:hypothetical protein
VKDDGRGYQTVIPANERVSMGAGNGEMNAAMR